MTIDQERKLKLLEYVELLEEEIFLYDDPEVSDLFYEFWNRLKVVLGR
jgi:hypothetical protein